jgi:hypothetical protein
MIVLFVICVVAAAMLLILGIVDRECGFGIGAAFTITCILSVALGETMWGEQHVSPLDVYRGKTTLEITYRDSVAVDSVVVWKEETK